MNLRLGLIACLAACLLLLMNLFQPQIAPATPGTCRMRGALPDPFCTPGSINPSVTATNLKDTICLKGWTATVRPPVSYTNSLKQEQMLAYGFTDSITAHEEDHLISLELGGHPTDPKNLWPEPGASPNAKDAIENKLHDEVCAGQLSLSDAQQRIAMDWQTALK